MKRTKLIYLLPLLMALTAFGGFERTENIIWYSLKEAQHLARENNKKVLIYAEAVWCTYCKKMEKEVFPRTAVIKSMNKYYYPVRLDIESEKKIEFNSEIMTGSQFARKYRVTGTPTTFFIDKHGEILGAQPGFIPADVFEQLLGYVGSDSYGEIEFEEYVNEHQEGK